MVFEVGELDFLVFMGWSVIIIIFVGFGFVGVNVLFIWIWLGYGVFFGDGGGYWLKGRF